MRDRNTFGALLRRYRLSAGLTQEALAEQAQLSVRAVMYLERGTRVPQPDTLSRLATALALTSAQQGELADAVLVPIPAEPEPDVERMPVAPTRQAVASGTPLVGREQELVVLRERLAASMAGQGGLVLLSGEAGVGKSALAEALCREAAPQGALVLIGRCYDLAETPPYGPWTEARAQFPPTPDLPPLPSALHTAARSPGQFFAEVRDFFAAAAAQQPLVVLLDDLQWGDPASLDLLRYLARTLGAQRFLILVTYRPGEIDRHHPLHALLPLLVREAHAARLAIPPLAPAALVALVGARYSLAPDDTERLVAYLARRTEGNALFATELLHALAEGGALTPGGTTVGDLEAVRVPLLLRQVVEGRVVRLGREAEELLAIAAVIGQEVAPELWARVAGADDTTVEEVAERALAAGLLVEARGGEQVAFAHALIREALYEGIPALRRRRWHRVVGEALAGDADALPDAVAYHFQQAGDARAATWLTRAAWRAWRSFAHATARARFVEALPRVTGAERARVLLALSSLDRFQEQGMRHAQEAVATARVAGDAALVALAQFRLGIVLSYHSLLGTALQAMEEAERVLTSIPDDTLPELYDVQSMALASRRNYYASVLGYTGRWHEVFVALGEAPETVLVSLRSASAHPNGAAAVISSFLLLGRPADAREAVEALTAIMAARKDVLTVLLVHALQFGALLMIPYLLDDRGTRRWYEAERARHIRDADEAMGAVPAFLDRCPLLIVTGEWAEARALWGERRDALTAQPTVNLPYVGAMARAQGEHDEAWALVREGLPDGLQTEPGTTHFTAVDLSCLAARLALDVGDHALARQWLEAHDRWLAWAGAAVQWGRANGHLAWAEYHRATGDAHLAMQRAEEAVAAASAPRQPLPLLASHRVLGDLLRQDGRAEEARAHLDTAFALAEACGAPYERALTLLARAELEQATGEREAARCSLAAARAICEPLGANATLARIAALADTPTGG